MRGPGRDAPPGGTAQGFLLKDENKAQVKVYERPVRAARPPLPYIKTLAVRNGLSLLECDLITGRTPPDPGPVRSRRHPLLGDGKYGRERDNKQYGRSYQALYSYKLRFEFTTRRRMPERTQRAGMDR